MDIRFPLRAQKTFDTRPEGCRAVTKLMVAEFGFIGKFRPGLLATGRESVSSGQQGVPTHRSGASDQPQLN